MDPLYKVKITMYDKGQTLVKMIRVVNPGVNTAIQYHRTGQYQLIHFTTSQGGDTIEEIGVKEPYIYKCLDVESISLYKRSIPSMTFIRLYRLSRHERVKSRFQYSCWVRHSLQLNLSYRLSLEMFMKSSSNAPKVTIKQKCVKAREGAFSHLEIIKHFRG